jgi:glycosyltransferase involved in cell wall biosynthesis
MKVLHINPYPPEHLGGSELFARNLAINLAQKDDINCDILTSDIFHKGINSEILKNSVNVFYKSCYFNLWGKNPVVNIIDFLLKYQKKYDIIHAHSYIFFTSHQCALIKKFKNFRFILNIHGGVDTPHFKNMSLLEKTQLFFKNHFFDNILGKFTIKQANALISVSNKDLKLIRSRFKLSHSKKTYFVPNGIDINKYQREKAKQRKFITFIGRLSYIKGIDIFIEIIKDLYKKDKNLNFLIVGDGPLRNLVENAKKKLPIKHYESYPYTKISDIYNISKILLLTSRFEGLPTTILESLSCETPVIASDVGGVSEVISNGINGYLFDLSAKEKIYKVILDLVHNETYLKKLGENGRKIIEKSYSWNIISNKIERIYRDLMKNS